MREEAETVAVKALSFVAADPELLQRFLAITGIEAHAVRRAASEPGFLAGVLQFILAHEPTLMRFAEETGTPWQNRRFYFMMEVPGRDPFLVHPTIAKLKKGVDRSHRHDGR